MSRKLQDKTAHDANKRGRESVGASGRDHHTVSAPARVSAGSVVLCLMFAALGVTVAPTHAAATPQQPDTASRPDAAPGEFTAVVVCARDESRPPAAFDGASRARISSKSGEEAVVLNNMTVSASGKQLALRLGLSREQFGNLILKQITPN